MAQFITVPQWVEAWKVPAWGYPADEPAPLWLTRAIQNGSIIINHLGGLSQTTLFGDIDCHCGDYAVHMPDGTIEFRDHATFISSHERLTA